MNKKEHFKLLTLGFCALLLIGCFNYLYDKDSDDKTEPIIFTEEKQFNERIPLYYNLDNPDTIYTRNKAGDFEEIEING